MNNTTMTVRIEQLRAMHSLMQNANDEDIYLTWATLGVPDEPSEEDFKDIAEDNEAYNESFDLFIKLISDDDYRW